MTSLAEKFANEIVFMGEDMEVAGAFGMNLPLRSKGHQELLLDMPLSEAIIIHSATGAALGLCVQWQRYNLVVLRLWR